MNANKTFGRTLVGLLAMVLAICAGCAAPQPADPLALVNSWQAALNAGDVDKALSFLAEDAMVTIVPAGPDGDGVYSGRAEIRGWYQTVAGGKGTGALRDCQTAGDTVTCLSTYADDGLKGMGVDSIQGQWVATLRDGRIQSYTFTISPESLAKFPPPPTAEPAATSTPSPEVRVLAADALVGRWEARYKTYVVLHEFKADGAMTVHVSGVGQISTGRYWFESELFRIEDQTGDCKGIVGSYRAYVVSASEQPVELRFVLEGEDACADRRNTLTGAPLVPRAP